MCVCASAFDREGQKDSPGLSYLTMPVYRTVSGVRGGGGAYGFVCLAPIVDGSFCSIQLAKNAPENCVSGGANEGARDASDHVFAEGSGMFTRDELGRQRERTPQLEGQGELGRGGEQRAHSLSLFR